MAFTVAAEPWSSPDGAMLRAMQRRELDDRYGGDDHEPGTAPTAGDITVCLVARTPDGQAVGCGALRQLDPRSAEIKLEPGTAQPEAMRSYEREGYGLIDNFGVYAGEPLSVCYAAASEPARRCKQARQNTTAAPRLSVRLS